LPQSKAYFLVLKCSNMTEKKDHLFAVDGVIQKLSLAQVENLRAIGHRVVNFNDLPLDRKYVVAASLTKGIMIVVTRKK